MADHTEDCCFNYVRDYCKGPGCACGCHQPRSVMRTQHPSDEAFIAWVSDGEGVDKLCTHTVQAGFREGWNAADRDSRAARDKAQALAATLSEDWHRTQKECGRLRNALAAIAGAFTNGVYCGSCGEPVDDCGCVIGDGRKALA